MTKCMGLSISCVIPMHNEEENVERIINDTENIILQLTSDWEIIIIESGSTDNTQKKLKEITDGRGGIVVLHQAKREGMGSALRLGYSKCTKDLICHLEADSPFEMIYFKKAIPILIENDFVIGYRVGPRGQNFRWSYFNTGNMAFVRALYHISYNLILRVVFGLAVRDANFSFKIFKREDVQKLQLISNGWFIDAEILLEFKRIGILPIEMPVEYKDRVAGHSTVNILTPFNMLYEMARYIAISRARKKEASCRT